MVIPNPQDTIVALSSAPGAGGRAVVRMSGPDAFGIASRICTSNAPLLSGQRRRYEVLISLPGMVAPVPVDLYVWPAPRTYTGQNLVELHLLSCLPLVDLLVALCLDEGARAAQRGEFTLRAFLDGKLDLPRAEAVLGIIEANQREELNQALSQLAGGVTQPLVGLRADLLDLLAEVEAGLDFSEEDIRFVEQKELLDRLARGLALVMLLEKQLDQRALADRPFRVVLAGRPNAGKSSLFNALVKTSAALVSPEPGTTRDYLVQRLELDGVALEMVDTAGRHGATGAIEDQAQSLGLEQADQADLLLMCIEAGRAPDEHETQLLRGQAPEAFVVATKCDLGAPLGAWLATSAITGEGLEVLRWQLAARVRSRATPALAPSLSRCRHHVHACLEHLRQAHAVVLYEEPPELLALELRGALDELGEMVGAVYTDDLLDRIFSRFCIGK